MKNELLFEYTLPNERRLCVFRGDITLEEVDAVVNAANEQLSHGAGVAGAIVRAGGEIIQVESDRLAPVATGEAVRTSAGTLHAKAVIHAVGPHAGMGDEDRLLRSAIRRAMEVASKAGDRKISVPAISAGIFGFPKDRCASILVDEVHRYLEGASGSLAEVRFCLWDEDVCDAFLREMLSRFSGDPPAQ